MEKPFDLKVIDSKKRLSQVINESKLPITVVNLILKDLLTQTIQLEEDVIFNQKEKFEESKEQ